MPTAPTPAQRLARWALGLVGWRWVRREPPAPKGIIVVYPHTSNWDFPLCLLFMVASGLKVHWLAKDTLFRGPFGPVLRRWGGIAVNRRDAAGFVDTLLAKYAGSESLWIALAPEGTRSRTDHWKSGFYRIAVAGKLPVGLGYIDYRKRTLGIETYLDLSGDPEVDFARLRAAYAGKRGRRPGNQGEIRLRS